MTPNEFTYPLCGCSCGCSMTAKSNCDDCYYRSKHSEMGATWSVCTQYSDLSEATRACENSKECKLKITHKQVREAIDRQIPQKVKYCEKKNDDFLVQGYLVEGRVIKWFECPKCGKHLRKYYNFCPHCSKALDWSDTK